MKATLLGLSLMVIGGTMLVPTSESSTEAGGFDVAYASFGFEQPSTVFAQCVGCVTCGTYSVHELTPTGGRAIPPGENHQGECWASGECWQWHLWDQNCPDDSEEEETLTMADRQALWLVAAFGSPDELLDALAQHPRTLKFNPERASVQMYGCSGDIVANFPLAPGRLAALQ